MSEKSRELMLKKKTPEDIRKIEQTQEALKQTLKALRSAPSPWRGRCFPAKLDLTVVTEYKDLFTSLTSEITNAVPFINIILVGEAAAGKSSLVNTFATALDGGKTIKTICNSGPKYTYTNPGLGSLTSTNHIEALHIGENMLHVRLHDLPGIAHTTLVREDELNMVIDGKIKPNAKIQTALEMAQNKNILRENPKPADKMHCIIYVIRATFNTSLDHHQSESLKVLRNIRNKRKAEDDAIQFAIVTAIDEIGVNNYDMENAYNYPCIRPICDDVSKALMLDPNRVIPVSNYFEEMSPTDAKNAMSLFALWKVCSAGQDYIKRNWGEKTIRADFHQ